MNFLPALAWGMGRLWKECQVVPFPWDSSRHGYLSRVSLAFFKTDSEQAQKGNLTMCYAQVWWNLWKYVCFSMEIDDMIQVEISRWYVIITQCYISSNTHKIYTYTVMCFGFWLLDSFFTMKGWSKYSNFAIQNLQPWQEELVQCTKEKWLVALNSSKCEVEQCNNVG